jgi:hypothetical protein
MKVCLPFLNEDVTLVLVSRMVWPFDNSTSYHTYPPFQNSFSPDFRKPFFTVFIVFYSIFIQNHLRAKKYHQILDFLSISLISSQFSQNLATVVSKVRLLKPGRSLTASLRIWLGRWMGIG